MSIVPSVGVSHPQLLHRGSRVPSAAPRGSRIVQSLDVILPLLNVDTLDAAVVGQEAIDLALDVGRLGPDAAAAGEELDLLPVLVENDVGAVVVGVEVDVDLVGLVDGVDGRLDVPQAVVLGAIRQPLALRPGVGREWKNLLVDGDVMPDTAELALEANSAAVVRGRLDRVEWGAALRVGVMVVVGEVSRTVVVPARCRVDQPAAVD